MAHPKVREAAVIGIPDHRWGELVTAVVVTDGTEVSAADLIAHCRERLAGYKCPKHAEFTETLPARPPEEFRSTPSVNRSGATPTAR
jgi:acyl-CoA synthetase (AMP-forming)/AMP-acid ligase II